LLNKLLRESEELGVEVREHVFKSSRLKGLYVDGVITLNPGSIKDRTEKTCVLAEEIGHHLTSHGHILDQSDIRARKQELRARAWAYERLVPLSEILRAYKARVKGRYEIAEFLEVTEDFLERSIQCYREKYGLCVPYGDSYIIYFDPLGVVELFE
jgi:hypothetical protein